MFLQLMAAAALATPAQNSVGPRAEPIGFTGAASLAADTLIAGDTVPRKRPRPHAIEYSDAYYTRLRIHQIASYAELPLFATEWILGQRLLNQEQTGVEPEGLKTAHSAVALGLGALFTVNTITGGWNLWESRHDPSGRTLRMIHSVAMLGADAGFMLAAGSAEDAGEAGGAGEGASQHRTIAISSMALATAATVMMWVFHD